MAIPRVALLCHLQRLPDYDGRGPYFGLTMSMAFDEPNPDVMSGLDWLKPWSYEVTGIRVWFGRDADVDSAVIDLPGFELPKRGSSREIQDHFGERLAALARSKHSPEALVWRFATGSAGQAHQPAESHLTWTPRWDVLLAQASRYPAPLGARLGLVFNFRAAVPAGDEPAFVWATPIFRRREPKSSADGLRSWKPTAGTWGPGPLDPDPEVVHQWAYPDAANEPVIHSYVYPAPYRAGTVGGIDVGTLWIEKPDDEWTRRDWLRDVPARVAQGFGLADIVVEAARARATTGADEPSPAVCRSIADAVLAFARDRCDVGIQDPPDGKSLCGLLVDHCHATRADASDPAQAEAVRLEADADKKALKLVLAEWEAATMDGFSWRCLVAKSVPELGDLWVVADGLALATEDCRATSASEAAPMSAPGDWRHLIQELERVTGALSREEVVEAVVLAQWDRAINGWEPDAPSKDLETALATARRFWKRFQGTLTTKVLPFVDTTTRLGLSSARPGVSRILQGSLGVGSDARDRIRERFQDALEAYERERTTHRAGSPYQRLPRIPDLSGALPDLSTQATAYGAAYAKEWLIPDVAASPETDEGISIQVLEIAGGEDEETSDDLADVSREIAGVGIVMRRKPIDDEEEPWRCLNAANVFVASKANADFKLAAPGAVAPSRLSFDAMGRSAILTYDNRPLVAESPDAAAFGDWKVDARAVEGDEVSALVRYGVAAGSVTVPARTGMGPMPGEALPWLEPVAYSDEAGKIAAWARLPGLAYGATYEVAAFAVSNTGALPRELARPGDPTRLALPELFSGPPENAVRSVEFARPERVGQVRWSHTKALTPVPEGVTPLAHDLRGPRAGPLSIDIDPEARALDDPVALLWDGHATERFHLSPPTVDLETWDRWVAWDRSDAMRETRWKVRRDVTLHRASTDPAKGADDSSESALDDPAVTRYGVALEPIYHRSGAAAVQKQHVPVGGRRAKTAVGVEWAQRERLGIEIERVQGGLNTTATLSYVPDAHKVVVEVPAGEIWRLHVHPMVSTAHDAKRFAADSRPDSEPLSELRHDENGDDIDYVFGEAFTLLVETVPNAPPRQDQLGPFLGKLLRVSVDASEDELHVRRTLRLRASVAGVGTPELEQRQFELPVLKDAEVRRQLWRWDGRHEFFPDLPKGDELPTTEEAWSRWEVPAFFTREEDVSTVHADLTLTDPPRFASAGATDPTVAPLLQEDVTRQRRFRYYRFGVRIWTRYRGLGGDWARPFEAERRHGGKVSPWITARLKARLGADGVVPVPSVRLVVPLTRDPAETPTSSTPGLLVMLDEPWYDHFGLAEKIEVQVVKAPPWAGDRQLGQVDPIEFGPDPIVSKKPAAWNTAWDEAAWRARDLLVFRPRGPIGHTFDPPGSFPALSATSFVLEPDFPRVKGLADGADDLGWHHVKVRIRRSLKKDSFERPAVDPEDDEDARNEGEAKEDAEGAHSEWAGPFWVQMLPDSNRVYVGDGKRTLLVRDLVLTPTDGKVEIHHDGARVDFKPEASIVESGLFSLWALVTTLTPDAFSGVQGERFVDWVPIEDGACVPCMLPSSLEEVNVRVVTIQHAPKALERMRSSADGLTLRKLWEALFPTPDATESWPDSLKDAQARIVSVSPPIKGS